MAETFEEVEELIKEAIQFHLEALQQQQKQSNNIQPKHYFRSHRLRTWE